MSAATENARSGSPLDVTKLPLAGTHLIEASAGTGKTFTITSLALRMVAEAELGIEEIVAVTFTNAATAELKDRVQKRMSQAALAVRQKLRATETEEPPNDPVIAYLLTLPEQELLLQRLETAERNADRAAIFTIHGFAQRMLSELAFESGVREDCELTGDDRALVYDVVADFWSSHVATLPEDLFRGIGGDGFFLALAKVARVAAGAHDLPLVPASPSADWERLGPRLRSAFDHAKEQFFAHGRELLELLLSRLHQINGSRYQRPWLESDFRSLVGYFAKKAPELHYPDEKRRWTQTRVLACMKKAHQSEPVLHDLLDVLEEYAALVDQAAEAARQEADRLRILLAEQVVSRMEEERSRSRTQSFDGLLLDLRTALRQPVSGRRLARSIRRKFPVALIDEFQDTDPVQYEIFRTVYGDAARRANETSEDAVPLAAVPPTALYLIGDPKQSIYGFRGADVHTYLRAGADAADSVWTLSTSYRASPRLVAAQNALFQLPREPFDLSSIRYQPIQAQPAAEDVLRNEAGEPLPGMVVLYSRRAPSEWLEATADEVVRFLNRGHLISDERVHPGRIAVLTRTNRQAQEMQRLLTERGVPAVMHGDRSVFESPEAVELRRVLLALAEPNHRTLVRTALGTRLLGLTAGQLAAFEHDVGQLETWSERVRGWGLLLRNQGVARALGSLWADVQLVERTLVEADGERRMTNFRHLLELLHEAESRQHLGVAGLLRFLDTAIQAPTGHEMAAEAMQVRLESDDEAVTLTTAHKSKGLEYDVVFLPSVGQPDRAFNEEAFRFHDEQNAAFVEVRSKQSRDTEDRARREAWQESLRLGYVALTRAKHHVVAIWGDGSKKFCPLGYLLHERSCADPGGPAVLEEFLKRLPREDRLAALERLATESGGVIAVEEEPAEVEKRYQPQRSEERLREPPPLPPLPDEETTSSFSAMTRERLDQSLSRAARAGHDVDEAQSRPDEAAAARETGGEDRCLLADFPRGAKAGDALHAVLEHAPFAEGDAAQRQLGVAAELGKRGFSKEQCSLFAQALEDVLVTPLGGSPASDEPFCLLDLKRERRVPEMEFSLPVGHTEHRLSVSRLCRALGFEKDPGNAPSDLRSTSDDPWLTPRYQERIARLGFPAWTGFLRGFVDLVFEHDQRLYVADYKSNHLGDDYSDYGPAALASAMEEHHYLLQGLLYAVAVHRYGQRRQPGYDYARHFGGVYYLFLRGMRSRRGVAADRTAEAPATLVSGAETDGVFFFRPSQELIERVSLALTPEVAA